jgi:hypothetical protein
LSSNTPFFPNGNTGDFSIGFIFTLLIIFSTISLALPLSIGAPFAFAYLCITPATCSFISSVGLNPFIKPLFKSTIL